MSREDKDHYAGKHPPGTTLNENVARAVRSRAQEGNLSCRSALEIARELSSVQPGDIGKTADLLEIPISQCQLGLFGYGSPKRIVKPADFVDPALEKAIQAGVVNGRLPCAAAFSISEQCRVSKLAVSSACERLKIKISACQLGAF